MARNRKFFINRTVVYISSRIQEGLPFVATPFMRLLLQSYLAGAQERYPVKIVAFLFMSNHFHLLLVVENPEDVAHFMEYFKRETAIAINRLLGRRQRTVWASGYDSPIVLDEAKMIETLVYIYTNPQEARLVNTIEDYPQLSTWNEFLSGTSSTSLIPTFRRDAVPHLSGPSSKKQAKRVYEEILSKSKHSKVLKIEPFAWLDCFADTIGMSPETVIERVVKQVRAEEARFQKEHGTKVLGAETLICQDIRTPYTPKKFGKKMICLADDKFKRIEFLQWYFDQKRRIERAMKDWKEKLIPPSLPPGFFLPGGKMTASLLPFVFSL